MAISFLFDSLSFYIGLPAAAAASAAAAVSSFVRPDVVEEVVGSVEQTLSHMNLTVWKKLTYPR